MRLLSGVTLDGYKTLTEFEEDIDVSDVVIKEEDNTTTTTTVKRLDTEEVIFDEIKDFVIVEGNAPPLTLTKIKKKKKSNNNKSLINAPRQKIKMVDDEFVAPLRIRLKTYGGSLRKKQILLFESENDKFDSKSCNDSENLDNNCFDDTDFETEKEISIPKDVGDLKNLQDCRKRMTFFRDSISNKSDHSLNDEEKIEDIFSKLTNFSNKSSKKNKYWTKYIKQQKKEIKLSRKLSFGSLKIKNSSTFKKEIKNPYNDLFILGILEKAAKEKKQKKMAKNSENNVWS
jgi:hypothetical protein